MVKMSDKVLAIDVGTQSVRALVFDGAGSLVDSVQVVYDEPYQAPHPGWAEQDADYYWEQLAIACRRLWNNGRATPGEIAALALTTQRATVVILDEAGKPLRPAILWLDQRMADTVPRIGGVCGLLLRVAGVRATVRALQSHAEVNWLREREPDLWKRARRFLYLSGYLTHKLTGEYKDSAASQVGYAPFDYRKQRWPRASHWMWRAIPVDRVWLPDLVLPGELIGAITEEAAAKMGFSARVPVIAAASDKACETLAAGCTKLHQGCIGYGTTATINVNSSRYREPIFLQPAYPSAIAGQYNLEIQIFRGFWLVSWFKFQFAKEEIRMAAELGWPAERLLDEQIADIPAGSLGLMVQPFWSPGVRYPGLEARGAMIGFSDAHTNAHVYKALLEGLAYSMRAGRERIERKSGAALTEMHVCGGGSQSDQMMQITADVLGMTVVRTAVHEAAGLGAAILASVAAGLHPDVEAAVGAMAKSGAVFAPDPARARLYDSLYRQVYSRMYGRLRPLYRSLRSMWLTVAQAPDQKR
ncbi:MAG: FGGY-family carbohydrate kinase [Bacilli bacterium]